MSEPLCLNEFALADEDGMFGFRLEWECGRYHADVTVRRVIGHDSPSGARLYQLAGEMGGPAFIEDPAKAEVYLKGFIKADGCSEFTFGEGCDHWCGPFDYKKHIALMEYLYHRAMGLILGGDDVWEKEGGK